MPDSAGTQYIRITTHASNDATGPNIDSGGMAYSLSSKISLSTEVEPYLLMCSAVTIQSTDCATASGTKLDFGTFSSDTSSSLNSQIVAASNSPTGIAISVLGSSLTSGNSTIDRLTSPTINREGRSQFGLNLRDNSDPNIGSDPTGTITPSASYNLPNRYMFTSGSVIASSSTFTDLSKLTISYVVNVDEDQEPGIYTSTLTYIGLATF